MYRNARLVIALILSLVNLAVFSQDNRSQFPRFVNNLYFNLDIGYINYPFTTEQLEPGFRVEKIQVPHMAVRLGLLGYRINKTFSVQISEMRPVLWIIYRTPYPGVRDDIVMNVGGLTLKAKLPISNKCSFSGEGGMGLISRRGIFYNDSTPIVKAANFATYLFGGSLDYHLGREWDLTAAAIYSPYDKKHKQPGTSFYSLGFHYSVNSDELKERQDSRYIFLKNLIQVGYTTNDFGYKINNLVSGVYLFWGGAVDAKNGFSVQYRRNLFHGKKVFALDFGTGFSYYLSRRKQESFYAISFFPVTKFTLVHTKPADYYFFYSVPGPTYLSKTSIDDDQQEKHFTFQDLMGIGVYAAKSRNLNAEIRIGHYSNGNTGTKNLSVKIPLTFNLGYAF